MTAYFDEATRKVSAAADRYRLDPEVDDEAFLALVAEVEDPIVRDVVLCTGDREFPDDLREKMLTAIAVLQVKPPHGMPETQGRADALDFSYSGLVERLHDLFHQLAGRWLKFRFGLIQDSPRQFLASRTEWDNR